MGRYITTEGFTEQSTKKRVNKMSLITAIGAIADCFLVSDDFIREAARDGIELTPTEVSVCLRQLSGASSMYKYKRNEFIRRKVTQRDREEFGWSNNTLYKYLFNVRGTVRTRGALGRTKVMGNLQNARFTGRVRNAISETE